MVFELYRLRIGRSAAPYGDCQGWILDATGNSVDREAMKDLQYLASIGMSHSTLPTPRSAPQTRGADMKIRPGPPDHKSL